MPSIITVAKATLLALPALASAAGQLGFSLGFAKGLDHKIEANCKTTAEFTSELELIKKVTGSNIIRLYTTSDCNLLPRVLPALKKTNSKVVLGMWSQTDEHFQKNEVPALEKYLPEYKDQVIGVTVGSEALYRKEETALQLSKKILQVKEIVKKAGADIPVGFADTWNLLILDSANPAIEASDLILANAFSYWQGQTMANATHSFFDDIMQALAHIQKVKGETPFEFWVGETNWPTDGASFENAVPSVENAATYWKEAICPMLKWGVNVFVFEAFDEPHKESAQAEGKKGKDGKVEENVEKYWGVFEEGATKPKFDLTCL